MFAGLHKVRMRLGPCFKRACNMRWPGRPLSHHPDEQHPPHIHHQDPCTNAGSLLSPTPNRHAHVAADSVAAVATCPWSAVSSASGMSSANTIHIMQPAANPSAMGSSPENVSTNT